MQAIKLPNQFNLIAWLSFYFRERQYEVLLFSFLLFILGNTFGTHYRFINILNVYQNFIIGFSVFYGKKFVRYSVAAIILISFFSDVCPQLLSFIDLRSLHAILYMLFFLLVAIEVFKEVLYIKTVSREVLAAAMCGFVLLCLIATFLFFQIDLKEPAAFSNVGDGTIALTNLNYFSFTTLLTIGYGDITPVSLLAKRAVMFVGLAGHFYTVFITSIIIGKYLSVKKD